MNTKHGKAKTKIYNIYYGMRDRCYNTNRSQYTDYGGRGWSIEKALELEGK